MDTDLFKLLSHLGGLDSSEGSSTYEMKDGSFFLSGHHRFPWQMVTMAENQGLITLQNNECHITDKGTQALADEYSALGIYTVDLREYRGTQSLTDRCPVCHKAPVRLYPSDGKGTRFLICSCGWLGVA